MAEDISANTPAPQEGARRRATQTLRANYRQIGAFGIVGVLNTILDFGTLNLLHFHFGMRLIPANLVSTTVAMVFSFFVNRRVVFRAHGGNRQDFWRQVMWFWLITAVGLYIIQTTIIWLGTHIAQSVFVQWGDALHRLVPIASIVIATNSIKLIASVTSLTWNYVWYKRVVFSEHSS